MTPQITGEIEAKKRRRVTAIVVLRALLSVTVLVALYYTLPIDEEWRLSAGARALVGLVLFIAVFSWQIQSVARSKQSNAGVAKALSATNARTRAASHATCAS